MTEHAPTPTEQLEDRHAPASSTTVEHTEDCPGAALVERETPRRRLLICTGCGGVLSRVRVSRWRDAPPAEGTPGALGPGQYGTDVGRGAP